MGIKSETKIIPHCSHHGQSLTHLNKGVLNLKLDLRENCLEVLLKSICKHPSNEEGTITVE